MIILPLKPRLGVYLKSRQLAARFEKQLEFLTRDPWHPSLHTELLEPRQFGVYSFRITRKFRALFVYRGNNTIEVVDINDHYQ